MVVMVSVISIIFILQIVSWMKINNLREEVSESKEKLIRLRQRIDGIAIDVDFLKRNSRKSGFQKKERVV